MGLFTSSSSLSQQQNQQQQQQTSPTIPTPSTDGAFEAPDRSSRARCWRARDDFFACLERHGIVDGIKERERAEAVCGAEGRGFEKGCAASWVTYFKQRRVMEYKKAQTLQRLVEEDAKFISSTGGNQK